MGLFKTIISGIGKFAQSAIGQTIIPTFAQFGLNALAAKKERKYAEEMWNKQNAYNSPVQQLARYREAGMNPAYGAGMASGNADKMSDAAASVARVEIPNLLDNLGRYQSLKNAVLEGDRIKAITQQELIKNQFLSETLTDRIDLTKFNKGIAGNKMDISWADSKFKTGLALRGFNPIMAKYNLDVQRFNQNTQMFELDKGLKEIGLNRERFGLNGTDSAFLRVLAQMWSGSEKGPNSMLPYVLGENAVNFIGGLAKNAIPKFPFQRYKFDVSKGSPFSQSGRTYFGPLKPNYNF